MIAIEKFCARNDACPEGREWVLANCTDMQDVWNKLQPEWLIWVACQPGVLTDKELQLFAVYCARSIERFLTDSRLKECINIAERFLGGEAELTDLLGNFPAFLEVFWEEGTPGFNAYKAACGLMQIVLPKNRYKAKDADDIAWASAWAVARDAENSEAEIPNFRKRGSPWRARERAMEANLQEKVKWLRENTKPNFEE
jgi:hypothetical protein